MKSVFRGGVYVAKNTLRGESVFLCAAHTKMRGSERIPSSKRAKPFCWNLLEFHRRGRLGGDVVEDAVDVLDLADDAAGDLVEKLPVDARPGGRHEVLRLDGAQRDGIVILLDVRVQLGGAMLDLGRGSGPMNHMFALEGEFVR